MGWKNCRQTNRKHNSRLLFTNVLVAFQHLIHSLEVTLCILSNLSHNRAKKNKIWVVKRHKWHFYSFEKDNVESLHFHNNSLMHFFQLELYTNVKMSYSRQWLCTFTMAHRELMHLCITPNRYRMNQNKMFQHKNCDICVMHKYCCTKFCSFV